VTRMLALLRRDLRGIYRDGFLTMMTGYSLVIALGTRIVVHWIHVPHIELYVAPFVVIAACLLVGVVFGFGLIEERETATWLVMRVTPVSHAAMVGYWVLAVSGFCFVIAIASALIYGVAPFRVGWFLALTAAAALGAPLVMLVLGAFASNKIQGLAMSKIVSSSSLLLVIPFVLSTPFQVLLLWYPWYWLYLGLLRAYSGPEVAPMLAVAWPTTPAWLFLVAPVLLSLVGIVILAGRLRRAQ
jgi:fluoroquinolone transport system permease protein